MPTGATETPHGSGTNTGSAKARRRQRRFFLGAMAGMTTIAAGLATLIPTPWARWSNGLGYRSLCPWAPTTSLICVIVGAGLLMLAFEAYSKKASDVSGGSGGGGGQEGVLSPFALVVAGLLAGLAGFSYPFTARSLEMQMNGTEHAVEVKIGEQGPDQIPLEPDFPGVLGGQNGAAGTTGGSGSGTHKSLAAPSLEESGTYYGETGTEWLN